MLDNNLLFSDAQVVTADAASTNDLEIGTPVNPLTIEVNVTAVSGTSPTCDITVRGSDDDSTYVDVVKFPQITAVGRYVRKYQAKYKYVRLYYDVGGTSPSFTVTAGPTVAGRDVKIG